MALLENTIPEPDHAKVAVRRLKRLSQSAFDANVRVLVEGERLVWNNPNATPAAVLAELGPDAASALQLADSLRALVNAAKPGTVPEPNRPAHTVHEDGTVTLD